MITLTILLIDHSFFPIFFILQVNFLPGDLSIKVEEGTDPEVEKLITEFKSIFGGILIYTQKTCCERETDEFKLM